MASKHQKTGTPLRILLADDHPLVREGLRSALEVHTSYKVVGEAGDGAEAVRLAKKLAPDVVIMDITMPGLNGLEATRGIREAAPASRVLIYTVHRSRDHMLAAIRAGAYGFISKEQVPDDLLRAVRQVSEGGLAYPPGLAEEALSALSGSRHRRPELPRAFRLSERERQVLTLVAEGLTNKEIASKLGVGVRTVETHRERLMEKLDIHSVVGLTRFAISQGLVELNYG